MIYAGPLLRDFMKEHPAKQKSDHDNITVSWDWLNKLVDTAAGKQLAADVAVLEEMVREIELTAQELDRYNFDRLVDKALLEKFIVCVAIARIKK